MSFITNRMSSSMAFISLSHSSSFLCSCTCFSKIGHSGVCGVCICILTPTEKISSSALQFISAFSDVISLSPATLVRRVINFHLLNQVSGLEWLRDWPVALT